MRRLGVYAIGAVFSVACSSGDRGVTAPPVGPPGGPAVDTVNFPDPTGSANPGRVHFNLIRSSSSNVPSSADSALVRIYNTSTGFNQLYAVKIPAPGSQTEVSAQLPADTGYVVAIIAFHAGDVLDALGSTHDNDTTITVLPQGSPTYTATPVHVDIQRPPFATNFSISDGAHVTAGEHIYWSSSIGTPPDIWTDASSTWGCSFNGNLCAVYSYQGTVPNTPGVVWPLQTTWIANWGDHSFSAASDTIHVTIDKGVGDIDVTFNKHRQPQH
jgi:hypothetical protein